MPSAKNRSMGRLFGLVAGLLTILALYVALGRDASGHQPLDTVVLTIDYGQGYTTRRCDTKTVGGEVFTKSNPPEATAYIAADCTGIFRDGME